MIWVQTKVVWQIGIRTHNPHLHVQCCWLCNLAADVDTWVHVSGVPRIMQRVLATWRAQQVSPCKYQSSHLQPDISPPPSNEYLKFLTRSPIKAIIAVYKSSSQQLHCCYLPSPSSQPAAGAELARHIERWGMKLPPPLHSTLPCTP